MPDTPPLDLAALRALLAAATPGPWQTCDEDSIPTICRAVAGRHDVIAEESNVGHEHDLELLCALRNAAPALLDAAEKWKRLEDHGRDVAERYQRAEYPAESFRMVPLPEYQSLRNAEQERDSLRAENERLRAALSGVLEHREYLRKRDTQVEHVAIALSCFCPGLTQKDGPCIWCRAERVRSEQ